MKKFLTLALALVMVLGIATSALAAGWDDISPAKPVAGNVTLSLDALSVEKQSSGLWNGDKAYAILQNTYAVIEGTKIHAVATVSFPKVMEEEVEDAIKAGKLQVRFDIDNGTMTEINGTAVEARHYYLTISGDPADLKGETCTYEIWAVAKSAQKNAVLSAKLGIYNTWKDGKFSFVKNGDEYTVEHKDAAFEVTAGDEDLGDNSVTFTTNGKADGKMDASVPMMVTYKGNTYEVSKQMDNTLAFRNDEGKIVTDATEYKGIKAVMDDVLGTLGFEYEGIKYMTEAHFEQKFGTQAEVGKTLVYAAGDVHQVVPGTSNDTSSVTPPQTGDNASIAGFVMIAVALIAAAAVTLKKVRA